MLGLAENPFIVRSFIDLYRYLAFYCNFSPGVDRYQTIPFHFEILIFCIILLLAYGVCLGLSLESIKITEYINYPSRAMLPIVMHLDPIIFCLDSPGGINQT